MINIQIKPEEVTQAKEQTKLFDAQKTYNKFNCTTNYIGFLGEIVLARYLKEHNISSQHIDFIKKGWNEPDFIINGKSIDLKTTYSDSMWFQQPKFDVYIYAQIDKDDSSLHLISYMTKQDMIDAKTNGKATQVTRGDRVDNVISPNNMKTIGEDFPPFFN